MRPATPKVSDSKAWEDTIRNTRSSKSRDRGRQGSIRKGGNDKGNEIHVNMETWEKVSSKIAVPLPESRGPVQVAFFPTHHIVSFIGHAASFLLGL